VLRDGRVAGIVSMGDIVKWMIQPPSPKRAPTQTANAGSYLHEMPGLDLDRSGILLGGSGKASRSHHSSTDNHDSALPRHYLENRANMAGGGPLLAPR